MSIFTPRKEFKPFEYPEALYFRDAVNHSFWLISEWNFISDVQDFHVELNDIERHVIKNAMLAISQIEVSVKKFWAKLGDRLPKAEFDQVGITLAESEVRHETSYSHLLEVLGLNDQFAQLLEVPAIQGRVDYLTKYLKGAADNSHENYTLTLTLFALFIENVSLFSQFLIIKSFNKYKNVLKDIDNVVQSTQQEENLHYLFGVYLINLIKKEFPEWFNEDFYNKIYRACHKAYEAESSIIDWIFENGELDFLPKENVKEFIKDRFNKSIIAIGGQKVFNIDQEKIKELKWFDEEVSAELSTDFFHKRPNSYSKFSKSITAGDLF